MGPTFVPAPVFTSVRGQPESLRRRPARWHCSKVRPPAHGARDSTENKEANSVNDVQISRPEPDGSISNANGLDGQVIGGFSESSDGAFGDGGQVNDSGLMEALDRSWHKLSDLSASNDEETMVFTSVDERIRRPVEKQIEETIETGEQIDAEMAQQRAVNEKLKEAKSSDGSEPVEEATEENGLERAKNAPAKRGRRKKSVADSEPIMTESDDLSNEAVPELPKPKPKPKVRRASSARLQNRSNTDFLSEAKEKAAVWDAEPKWFFLQVKPGCEQSCAISLRNLGRSLPKLGIREVSVPAMQIMRLTKGGKSVSKEERIYPSYILIYMLMNHESYSKVQSIPNVQFFMGDPNRDKKKNDPFMPPLPVSGSELREVFARMKSAEKAKPETRTVLRPGNTVKIVEGEYEEKLGVIQEIKPEVASVTVKLRHYARWVVAPLGIAQVVKVNMNEEELRAAWATEELGEELEVDESAKQSKGKSTSEDEDTDDGFVDALVTDEADPEPVLPKKKREKKKSVDETGQSLPDAVLNETEDVSFEKMLAEIENIDKNDGGNGVLDDLFLDDPAFDTNNQVKEDIDPKQRDAMQELLSLFEEQNIVEDVDTSVKKPRKRDP